ncbi:hypothetical protein HPB50_026080 [Hyalomma asiaticum]|uniref:Uncharacterized protein n=1 Tax=Hyalomma asiaticum TaxID=266040 RepID=A0ACB7RKT6_HYAAI|nr:hypothetical protein HPB50_026080 [Hyalomma asiaticum]
MIPGPHAPDECPKAVSLGLGTLSSGRLNCTRLHTAARPGNPGLDLQALEEASIVPENAALSDYANANVDMTVYEELSDAEILRSARAAAD